MTAAPLVGGAPAGEAADGSPRTGALSGKRNGALSGKRTGALSGKRTGALSRKEEALWLFQRLVPQVAVDNLVFAIRTSAALDPSRLAGAVRELAARHPGLRTVFPAVDGRPTRHRLDSVDPPVSTVSTTEDRLRESLGALTRRPFDLTAELPFRVHAVSVGTGSVLCLVVHHIVFDGRSAGLVLPELSAIYESFTTAPVVEPLAEEPSTEDSFRYWTGALAGLEPSAQPLQRARPEPPAPAFTGARLYRDLAPRTRMAVDRLRSRLRVTENMVLLAAYAALLARHGAGPDLVIAVPVDIRGRHDTMRVGFHVNTIPVRITVDPSAGFAQLVAQVRDRLLGGLDHADVSFESLLGDLGLESMNWRAPLFRHMFNFLPPATVVPAGPLPDAEWLTVDPGLSRYDLQFVVLRWPGRIELQAVYGTEILDQRYVADLVDRFELVLRRAAEDPDAPVAALDLWRPEEHALVAAVNDTDGAEAPPVAHRIAARVAAEPTAEALIDTDTYDRRALAVRAAAIRAGLDVGQGDVVAVTVRRGLDLAAAVLAIWSLGAAYLPVDAAQPADRLRTRLDLARSRVTLSEDTLPPGTTDDTKPLLDGLAAVAPPDRAYVIFTSGSTGEPKGVEITHAALGNLVDFFARRLEVAPGDRVLWLTSFGFDISGLELFLPLGHGGAAVVAPDDAWVRPQVLLDLVTRHDIGVVQTTPTIWRVVAGRLDDQLAGRRVLCGGEPLSAALAERLLTSGCRLFNVYGPTETTIWSTVQEVGTGPVTVGTPIARTVVDVADPDGRPVPPGIVGELRIGGAGVALGYVARPDLTAERFRTDPRLGRHYRTGDLATWQPGGALELIGRVDRQLKLRGRRIEPGEIEAALERHPHVAAAAVVVLGDAQSDGRLIGYVQPHAGSTVDNLREHVGALLPRYLVPADLVVLPALPRTGAGKVNYRALPEPPAPTPATPDTTRADPLTATFVELWGDVLGRDDVGPDSNFFIAGGQSLLAAVVAARAGELTGHDVSLQDVFVGPTPRELARIVAAARIVEVAP